jgi:hypothetical protein
VWKKDEKRPSGVDKILFSIELPFGSRYTPFANTPMFEPSCKLDNPSSGTSEPCFSTTYN